jgi:hypothetical protein
MELREMKLIDGLFLECNGYARSSGEKRRPNGLCNRCKKYVTEIMRAVLPPCTERKMKWGKELKF